MLDNHDFQSLLHKSINFSYKLKNTLIFHTGTINSHSLPVLDKN